MDLLSAKGLVISRNPVNEVDAMIRVISRQGVTGFFLPRGFLASSRFLGIFQPLHWVDFLFSKRLDLRVIYDYTEYEKCDPGILDNAEARELLFDLVRTYSRLQDAELPNDLGRLFTDVYDNLAKQGQNIRGLRFSFLMLFLLYEGIFPALRRCAICGRTHSDTNYFSPQNGGYICKECSIENQYSHTDKILWKALNYTLKNPEGILEKSNWNDDILRYTKVLTKYLNYHFIGGL